LEDWESDDNVNKAPNLIKITLENHKPPKDFKTTCHHNVKICPNKMLG
jgi:hypothetical protein